MFPLRCSVRQCPHELRREDARLVCEAGHSFDRARQGYWPLLQPQDRHSLKAGDHEDAVDARARWLARGKMRGLVEHLLEWKQETHRGENTKTLELGSGEGTLARQLFSDEPGLYCGIELAKKAVKLAARTWTDATWVLANADRSLPVDDGKVERVVSLFGRRPIAEIARVLDPQGSVLVVVPGQNDLVELREAIQGEGTLRDRSGPIIAEFEKGGLALRRQSTWIERVELETDAVKDALAMTYRGVRFSENPKLESLQKQQVTLEALVLQFAKAASPAN